MISSKTSWISRCLCKHPIWACRSFSSAVSASADNRRPETLFFDEKVQDGLLQLTRVDYEKVFRTRKEGRRLVSGELKFMTDDELKKAQEKMKKVAKARLHIPPVVTPRSNETKVLSMDPALQGYTEGKYVFTDISYGISNKMRLIVVRDTDGTLRHANLEERNRMNQIYFPVPGREIFVPRVFQDEYLKNLLEQKEYEHILDRTCAQFEPDDPQYQRITRIVYKHVNVTNDFDCLRSTRHFGGMVFHLLWTKDIDNLLIDVIKSGHINEADALLRLYQQFYPNAEIITEETKDADSLTLIKQYAEKESSGRMRLEKVLATYEEMENEKRKLAEGIKKAHGQCEPTEETDNK